MQLVPYHKSSLLATPSPGDQFRLSLLLLSSPLSLCLYSVVTVKT